jgi:hypothetical protein
LLDNPPCRWHQGHNPLPDKLFTWWNGETFGTQLWTWRFGELVGKDEQGNRYYRILSARISSSAAL